MNTNYQNERTQLLQIVQQDDLDLEEFKNFLDAKNVPDVQANRIVNKLRDILTKGLAAGKNKKNLKKIVSPFFRKLGKTWDLGDIPENIIEKIPFVKIQWNIDVLRNNQRKNLEKRGIALMTEQQALDGPLGDQAKDYAYELSRLDLALLDYTGAGEGTYAEREEQAMKEKQKLLLDQIKRQSRRSPPRQGAGRRTRPLVRRPVRSPPPKRALKRLRTVQDRIRGRADFSPSRRTQAVVRTSNIGRGVYPSDVMSPRPGPPAWLRNLPDILRDEDGNVVFRRNSPPRARPDRETKLTSEEAAEVARIKANRPNWEPDQIGRDARANARKMAANFINSNTRTFYPDGKNETFGQQISKNFVEERPIMFGRRPVSQYEMDQMNNDMVQVMQRDGVIGWRGRGNNPFANDENTCTIYPTPEFEYFVVHPIVLDLLEKMERFKNMFRKVPTDQGMKTLDMRAELRDKIRAMGAQIAARLSFKEASTKMYMDEIEREIQALNAAAVADSAWAAGYSADQGRLTPKAMRPRPTNSDRRAGRFVNPRPGVNSPDYGVKSSYIPYRSPVNYGPVDSPAPYAPSPPYVPGSPGSPGWGTQESDGASEEKSSSARSWRSAASAASSRRSPSLARSSPAARRLDFSGMRISNDPGRIAFVNQRRAEAEQAVAEAEQAVDEAEQAIAEVEAGEPGQGAGEFRLRRRPNPRGKGEQVQDPGNNRWYVSHGKRGKELIVEYENSN